MVLMKIHSFRFPGFQWYHLPYEYHLHQLRGASPEEVAGIVDLLLREQGSSPLLGGASVTIPFKEILFAELSKYAWMENLEEQKSCEASETRTARRLCVHRSSSSRAMGATNTLVRLPTKQTSCPEGSVCWLMDNTDWIGIRDALSKAVARPAPPDREDWDASQPRRKAALIVGAGGTARAALYALQHSPELGFESCFASQDSPTEAVVMVWNPRTPSRATALLEDFLENGVEEGCAAVISVPDSSLTQGTLSRILGQAGRGDVSSQLEFSLVINTLPGAAEFRLPEDLLLAPTAVVFDAVSPGLPRDDGRLTATAAGS